MKVERLNKRTAQNCITAHTHSWVISEMKTVRPLSKDDMNSE